MKQLLRMLLYNKLSRFAIGGLITFSIKVGLTIFLTEMLEVWYFASYIASLIVILVFSFFYNAYITFEVRHDKRKNFIKYGFLLIIFLLIDAAAVKIFTDWIGLHYTLSIIGITIVMFVVKFITYDRLVFIKKNRSQINGMLSPLLQLLRIRQAKRFFKGNSFLDIGCSLGELIPYLPKHSRYVGIEGNEGYFNAARKKNPNHNFINIYLDENNVDKLGITDKFDTILALAVIEHLDYPEGVLKGLKRYLSRDGRMIITTPAKKSESLLNMGSKLGLFTNEMHEHKRQFTKRELIMLVRSAGYRIIKYRSFELGMNHLIVIVPV